MKKNLKYIYIILILSSSIFPSSSIKSLVFPGWGEINEFKILSNTEQIEDIKYIKERSNNIMFLESAIWIGLFTSNQLNDSYRNDYRVYGVNNANVDWSNKTDLYAANVGNFNNFTEYNEYKLLTGQYSDLYDENEGYEWDWQDDNAKRLKYDKIRNKSEKSDKIKTYMLASLFINRVISTFDVLSIKRNHGRLISFDVDNNSNNFKLNFNYTF